MAIWKFSKVMQNKMVNVWFPLTSSICICSKYGTYPCSRAVLICIISIVVLLKWALCNFYVPLSLSLSHTHTVKCYTCLSIVTYQIRQQTWNLSFLIHWFCWMTLGKSFNSSALVSWSHRPANPFPLQSDVIGMWLKKRRWCANTLSSWEMSSM